MLIGNRKIKEEIVTALVFNIKKKKELAYLADGFVEEAIKRHLSQNAKVVSFLSGVFSERSSAYKQIVKEVRNELRRVHGLYKIQQDILKRRELFEQLLQIKVGDERFLELHQKILKTHSSTRERLPFYGSLYTQLFKVTGKPKRIIDLGSGINPFSIPLMGLGGVEYFAYDISDDEITLLREYFQFFSKVNPKIKGKAEILDLLQWEKVKKLKRFDLCFLWKMTDMLDRTSGHKVSEQVIVNIPAKFVVVSFPTFTVSGKPMNQPRRKWIELMCERLGFEYKIIKEKNEIFYVVRKR
ncbi:MAG: hypothetical protein ABIA37_04770 [Candidatus Woesearchaeota archaeon]